MSNKPIIVIDPGHGGTTKVGGSSPNNAVGANGLLEKHLTLDMANRVAATLAAQADVFLTRAADTNIGLSDRAKFAREKNAALFLSIHFNGFTDANVDGTEVWVAKKANQSSRDFAKTLLSKIVSSTHLKDRGVREGDLGVILPTRHASGTSACLLEISFLTNPNQAKQLESDTYRQNIANAIVESVRQYLSLTSTSQSYAYGHEEHFDTTVLADATMDEIAAELGYGSLSNYVSTVVKPATLFGLSVGGGLYPDYYKKLQKVEKDAALLIHPDGSPVKQSEWGIANISGCQPRRKGWHPWGLAVDIDYIRNPYIMHESGETAYDAMITPVYHRIARFILKRDSVIPKGITESVKGESKKDRVSRLYDRLLEESNAMKLYFKAMQDQTLLQNELNKHDLFDVTFWENVWGVKGQTPSLDWIQEIMMRDYVALSGQRGPGISGKTYPDAMTMFKGISGDAVFVGRKPENGFLTLRKEIITAMTNAGLRWGAIDFGGASGDVMHFDDGWGSFAGKITAAKAKLSPKAKSKSSGYDENWGEQFDYAEPFGKTYTVADVKWAADKVSIDYRHLNEPIDTTPFELNAAHLKKLCEANYFNVKSNENDPRDEVIFALRGCQIADGKESSGGFVSSIKLIEAVPDHQQSKCVIGVWKRSANQIAVFLGSTVPYWKGMKKQLESPSKNICNLLSTGRYLYTVGTHRASEAEFMIPGAIRQQSDVSVLRTKDNLIYEVTDDWDFGDPGDNIHPSRHSKPTDKFSSEGCLTIPGGGTFMTRNDKHDRLWSEFRKAAGLSATSAPSNEDGFQFVVVLLTGREARLANKAAKSDLTRLRFGSEGVDVKALQMVLSYKKRKAPATGKYYAGKMDGNKKRKAPATGKYYAGKMDGNMARATVQAFITWQKDQDGSADGIVTPAIAKSLGIDIINHLCLKDPVPLPRSLSEGAKPRKLTAEEIDYYKKLAEKQNNGGIKGKTFLKRIFDESIVWELPENGEGYVIYNRNDLAGRKEYQDAYGLDEIGTKETIEKIIAIAKEWHKMHADQPLQIGDISRPGGIDTPDHNTHMDGKAVDVRPLRIKNGSGGFTYHDTKIYSPSLTKEFIRLVRKLYPNTTFHFNDKAIYGDAEFKAFVTPSKGHDNHLHIMFD